MVNGRPIGSRKINDVMVAYNNQTLEDRRKTYACLCCRNKGTPDLAQPTPPIGNNFDYAHNGSCQKRDVALSLIGPTQGDNVCDVWLRV